MAIENPLILLPYQDHEFHRKPGGGGYKEPLVPVTPDLTAGLAASLESAALLADSVQATASDPLAVKVVLRSRALAKSNRPYGFLSASALPVTAGERRGELVVEATGSRLRALASAVRTATSKPDLFAVSTIEAVQPWDLVRDVLGAETPEEAVEWLASARNDRELFRLVFFPWVERPNYVPREIALGPQALDRPVPSGLVQVLNRIGLEVSEYRGTVERPVAYVPASAGVTLQVLGSVPGLRSVEVATSYAVREDVRAQSIIEIRPLDASDIEQARPTDPIVGVLDSGVYAGVLEPSVVAREPYDPPQRQDMDHGTFVAALVVSPATLNPGSKFPADKSRVLDAQIMSAGRNDERTLFARLEEVVRKYSSEPGVRVWNCSFGASSVGRLRYSALAQDLDELSDELGILFVVAAGNNPRLPPRPWPPVRGVDYGDGINSPSESIRAVSVGAISHRGGASPTGFPASYSRKGPSFAAHVKPDLGHYAGDVDANGVLPGHGTHSLVSSDRFAESAGTSFAAPLISTIAANVWQTVERSGSVSAVTPELVRGLLVHSASLSGPGPAQLREYQGWGIPTSAEEILSDLPTRFTTVSEVVMTPGNDWVKRPFPVPAPLMVNGKLRARVTLTIAYAPPINAAFGDEAVRYDVSGGFGRITVDSTGTEHFAGLVTAEGGGRSYWEEDQVADGKWSPVKTVTSSHPRGVSGTEWALRLTLTERMSNEIQVEQRVYVILTLEALDGDATVRAEGLRAVARLQYPRRLMAPDVSIQVRAEA